MPCGLSPNSLELRASRTAAPPLTDPLEKPEAMAAPGRNNSQPVGFLAHVDSNGQTSRELEGLARESLPRWLGGDLGAVSLSSEDDQLWTDPPCPANDRPRKWQPSQVQNVPMKT